MPALLTDHLRELPSKNKLGSGRYNKRVRAGLRILEDFEFP